MVSELKKRILSSIILFPIVFFFVIKGSYYFLLLLIISFIISSYEWHLLAKKKPYYILGFIFLICSFSSIYEIRISQNSYEEFIIILFICIFTDIGGYAFGKTFKGPKLTSYSPKKTISGLVGSYLLSLLLIPFFFYFNLYEKNFILSKIMFVILISTVSQLGDIIISYFKRKSNLKDTGKIIPGHGGLLDRIDGMIFAFPFAYLIMLTNLFVEN
tara:strand:+ start:166 stop:810 length:645 start_codon:yes stop_codon:yes gene_type:complete